MAKYTSEEVRQGFFPSPIQPKIYEVWEDGKNPPGYIQGIEYRSDGPMVLTIAHPTEPEFNKLRKITWLKGFSNKTPQTIEDGRMLNKKKDRFVKYPPQSGRPPKVFDPSDDPSFATESDKHAGMASWWRRKKDVELLYHEIPLEEPSAGSIDPYSTTFDPAVLYGLKTMFSPSGKGLTTNWDFESTGGEILHIEMLKSGDFDKTMQKHPPSFIMTMTIQISILMASSQLASDPKAGQELYERALALMEGLGLLKITKG